MAFTIGIDPQYFWGMTPYQFKLCLDGWNDRRTAEFNDAAWMMWHNAYLSRAQFEEFPKIEDFMQGEDKDIDKKQNDVPIADKNVIITAMKRYNEEYLKEQKKNGTDSKTNG